MASAAPRQDSRSTSDKHFALLRCFFPADVFNIVIFGPVIVLPAASQKRRILKAPKGIVTLSLDAPISTTLDAQQHQPRSAGSRSSSVWTGPRFGWVALFAAAGVLATRGVWEDIYRIAMRDEEASHIWLVPVLVGWLIWIRRSALAASSPRSSLVGPLLVAIGWAISHWGFHGPRQAPWHFGALLVVIGCVATLVGPGVLLKIWPALVVLAMIVPVPGMVRQRISIPLEQATAFITTGILKLFGAPVERFGNMITIRGYPVRVAEECNGLRMIFPLLLIVWVFCFTLPLRGGVRAILLITSPLSAIACNVIRLLPTVLVFGYASESAGRKFHDYSGWPMLPIAFLLLMLIVWMLRKMRFKVLLENKT